MIKLPIEIGDILLVGRFKNKRIKVKEIGTDEHGLPTVNGRGILKIRIEKLMEPKKNLKEGTMSLKDLENYFYENESDIRDNMKIYGFKLKDISKIRNYMDLASVLGADSNDVKDVDLRQYTDTLADLLKNEQQESKQFSLAQTVKKILKENEYKSKLDKQFKNEHGDLSIIKRNAIKSDNSGPYATTATSIDEYDVVSLSEKKYDKNYILNWAREIWKSSSMVDRKVDKVMAFKDMWTVTVTTTVWQN